MSTTFDGGDDGSDYDPLFDDGDEGESNADQRASVRTTSIHRTESAPSLALPHFAGSSPMRNVENVGTIAPPVSLQFFSERPCDLSSSPSSSSRAASHIASKKRPRESDTPDPDQQRASVRPRTAARLSTPSATSSPRTGGTPTSDWTPTKDPRGVAILVPRPKALATRPSADGPLHTAIVSFLTHDREFIGSVRSYVHLLAHPPETSGSRLSASQQRTVGSKRPRRKVPANAADWDIPFPFAEGEAPPGYLESWALKKVRSLINQMLAALHRAVFKVELLRCAKSDSDLTLNPRETPSEILGRASESAPAVHDWLKLTLRTESVEIKVDPAPLLSLQISDVLDGFSPEDQRVDQPIAVSQTVEALKVSITSAQMKYQQQHPTPPGSVPTPRPSALDAVASTPTVDGAQSSEMVWSASNYSSATSPSIATPNNALSGVSSSTSLPSLGGDPSSHPFILDDPQFDFDASSFANLPDFTFGSDPNQQQGEASVMDWLWTSYDGSAFSADADGASSSLGATAASCTPASLSNVPLPIPSLPTSSWGGVAFAGASSDMVDLSFIPNSAPAPAPLPQSAPPIHHQNRPPNPKPQKPPPATIIPDIKVRKRQLTRPQIAELQRQTTQLAAASRPSGGGGEVRVVKVSEVKARAEEVRLQLSRELADVEREMWALDIEREVLMNLRAAVDGGGDASGS